MRISYSVFCSYLPHPWKLKRDINFNALCVQEGSLSFLNGAWLDVITRGQTTIPCFILWFSQGHLACSACFLFHHGSQCLLRAEITINVYTPTLQYFLHFKKLLNTQHWEKEFFLKNWKLLIYLCAWMFLPQCMYVCHVSA